MTYKREARQDLGAYRRWPVLRLGEPLRGAGQGRPAIDQPNFYRPIIMQWDRRHGEILGWIEYIDRKPKLWQLKMFLGQGGTWQPAEGLTIRSIKSQMLKAYRAYYRQQVRSYSKALERVRGIRLNGEA